VLYAFVLSRDARSSDVPVVPVLNLPRADLSLRPDAQWLLAEARAPSPHLQGRAAPSKAEPKAEA
jgi:hypothetical protein